jgi:hypothetical protein
MKKAVVIRGQVWAMLKVVQSPASPLSETLFECPTETALLSVAKGCAVVFRLVCVRQLTVTEAGRGEDANDDFGVAAVTVPHPR